MPLPPARGPLSAATIAALVGADSNDLAAQSESLIVTPGSAVDFFADEDAQLTLTLLYELHLRGIVGVDDGLQWDPGLMTVLAGLERHLDRAIDAAIGPISVPAEAASYTVGELVRRTVDDDTAGVSVHVRDRATVGELTELLIHRSLYQLREADLHTFGIPRIGGRAKAALIEIQADEYGGGSLPRMHSTLFADTMAEFGLQTGYMYYLPVVPAITLAGLNVLSRFGLHRTHVGELIGHLCAIEMTSSLPSGRYVRGLTRLGASPRARRFYDEHIEADAAHEQIAMRDLVGGWVDSDPVRGAAVLRGAAAFLALEDRIGTHLLDSWSTGKSSLVAPVPS
ncbi:iron-containing redox enzyme family protein [Jongsikchunia kroppenstedtii]|uniref:iron-containing redox enzyme family protein n=1 Tax=Jongsikchunia kroppenstedtii TaxID=1121721 RepID=UPI00036BA927|nr:iron-containing redox enzyme family protein [Jongsikchunia kroppenstedtii]